MAPVITSEKSQYWPEETVLITGNNFGVYEKVTVEISYNDPYLQQQVLVNRFEVFADGEGRIDANWKIPARGTYEVKALGGKSGHSARTTVSSLVPTPITFSGNPSCATVNASTNPALAHVMSNFGFKVEGNTSGTYPFINDAGPPQTELTGGAPADPGNSVTTTVTNSGRDLAWTSTRVITAVIVKSGSNANVYPYDPASTGDPGPLTGDLALHEISHVEFCYNPSAKITIFKNAAPPSPNQQFDFTTTNLTPSAFSLTDDQINSDPMQMFTVNSFNLKTITETGMGSYSLQGIDCTVDIGTGGTPTPVRSGNSIQIDIKPGDQVTCTFRNAILTAAAVSVSGRVFDTRDRGLSRAVVRLTGIDGTVRAARTNPFGYFRFEDVEAGQTYVIEAYHKLYRFTPQTINLDENAVKLTLRPNSK